MACLLLTHLGTPSSFFSSRQIIIVPHHERLGHLHEIGPLAGDGEGAVGEGPQVRHRDEQHLPANQRVLQSTSCGARESARVLSGKKVCYEWMYKRVREYVFDGLCSWRVPVYPSEVCMIPK